MIDEAQLETDAQPQPIVHAMDTPHPTEDTALLDAHEVLTMDVYQKGGLALFQQAVAQLAAIRELIEAEHAVQVAARIRQRGGPRCQQPPNGELPEPTGCLAP